MKRKLLISLVGAIILSACTASTKQDAIQSDLRAPAYPLVTIDPYTSAWAFTDNLYDGAIKHWTGKDFPLLGVLKVDGESYRFMGKETPSMEAIVATSEQEKWEGKYTTKKPAGNWMNEKIGRAHV